MGPIAGKWIQAQQLMVSNIYGWRGDSCSASLAESCHRPFLVSEGQVKAPRRSSSSAVMLRKPRSVVVHEDSQGVDEAGSILSAFFEDCFYILVQY